MKLYTREQMIEAFNYGQNPKGFDWIGDMIDSLTAIQLPSDEEIEEMANRYAASKRQLKHLSNREFDLSKNDFIKASKWMREQILNQTK